MSQFRPARSLVAALTVGLLSACTPAVPPAQERTYISAESGYRYVAPPQWKVLRGELRSPNATLITIQAPSLEDGDEAFINGLPGSIEPQLKAWAEYYYRVVEKPSYSSTTLGGEPAREVSYPVKIRPTDKAGTVTYVVARHGERVFVVRVNYPPGAAESDEPAVREFLASWQFTQAQGVPEEGPPGTFVLTVPKKPGA